MMTAQRYMQTLGQIDHYRFYFSCVFRLLGIRVHPSLYFVCVFSEFFIIII